MSMTSKEIVINTLNGIPAERIAVTPHWWGLYKFEISLGMKDYSEEYKAWEHDAEALAKVDSDFYELFKPDIFHLTTALSVSIYQRKKNGRYGIQ